MLTCAPNRALRATPATLNALSSATTPRQTIACIIPPRYRGAIAYKQSTPNRYFIASTLFRKTARDLAPIFNDDYAIAASVLRYHIKQNKS